MTIKHVQKRPVKVYALQWTGDNLKEVQDFVGLRENGECKFLTPEEISGVWNEAHVWISAEQDWAKCPVGHYVIQGVSGEFYPCGPDIFDQTYEDVEDSSGGFLNFVGEVLLG